MLTIPKGDAETPAAERKRGVWYPWLIGERILPVFCCPGCGESGVLPRGKWHVAADGTVSPSIDCRRMVGGEPCGFHDFVRLEGWKP